MGYQEGLLLAGLFSVFSEFHQGDGSLIRGVGGGASSHYLYVDLILSSILFKWTGSLLGKSTIIGCLEPHRHARKLRLTHTRTRKLNTHANAHTHAHTNTHMQTLTHTHTHAHTCTYTHTGTHTYTHKHTYKQSHTHTCTHTQTHTHTHAHTP